MIKHPLRLALGHPGRGQGGNQSSAPGTEQPGVMIRALALSLADGVAWLSDKGLSDKDLSNMLQ